MSVTAQTIIADALGLLMVNGASETPDASDAALCLRTLNRILDTWSLDRMTTPILARSVYNLSASTASYTIGSGGTFNQARPERIVAAAVIVDPSQTPVSEVEIPVLDSADWLRISTKASSGTPAAVYYDRAYAAGLGTVHVWPVPETSTPDLVLYTPTAITAFADLSTAYVLPSGLEDALVSALAVKVAPHFEVVPSPLVVREALRTERQFRAANLVVPQLRPDEAVLYGTAALYDPDSDA